MTTLAGRARPMVIRLEGRRAELVVAAGAAVWATVISVLAVMRHDAFWTGRFDLGNMTQAVWSTLHGAPLESTSVTGEQISRLGAHVDPLLLLVTPFYAVWPDPRALLVAQAVIVALGAFPAYWLARAWIGEPRLALAVPAAYLLYPPLQWAVLTDMHPVTLVAPLILLVIWAGEERRDVLLAAAVVLALLGKENVGLTIAGLGLWFWLARGRRGAGLAMAAGGLAWTAIAVGVVQPRFGGGESPFAGRYESLGGSPGEVLATVLTRPWEAAQILFENGLVGYLLALLVPLLLLPLLSPGLAAVALPEIGLNLLSEWDSQRSIEFHYVAVIAPVLVAAAARGLARVVNGEVPGALRRLAGRPALPAVALVAAVALAGVVQGPMPWWSQVPFGSDSRAEQYVRSDRVDAMEAAVALIPDDVPVSAGNLLAGHLSERGHIYTFPTIRDAEYVVVDRERPFVHDLESRRRYGFAIARFRTRTDFEVVFSREGVTVYRRVA